MKSIASFPDAAEAFDTLGAIRALGLEARVAELDAYGYTIVPPEQLADAHTQRALREAVLALAERRSGVRPDLETGETHAGLRGATGQHHYYTLFEAPEITAAVVNPVVTALIQYLLGRSATLSSCSATLKGPGSVALDLHSDNGMIPSPFPAYAQVANATWILSAYSRENGSICFTPGSHKLCRHPTLEEVANPDLAQPVNAPAGSLIVWHGNTWHGAFPRSAPGIRVALIMYFCRMYLRAQEEYLPRLSPEAVAALPERVRYLIGEGRSYPFGDAGPDPKTFLPANTNGKLQAY